MMALSDTRQGRKLVRKSDLVNWIQWIDKLYNGVVVRIKHRS
jgi:hypothetical protein